MFDQMPTLTSAPDDALIDIVRDCRRAENIAAAKRLAAIAVLVGRRASDHTDERWGWRFDPWDALAAQISAAQGIAPAHAAAQMRCAQALALRLPTVAERFSVGDIDFHTVALVVQRTELLLDDDVVRRVDSEIAKRIAGWEKWSRRRVTAALDALVMRHDPDAKRRSRNASDARHVNTYPMAKGEGLAELSGIIHAESAAVLNRRLDELAGTVCAGDPRSVNQRRADAILPLALRQRRLPCACGNPDCPARQPARADEDGLRIVVHMVADEPTITGSGDAPGYMAGFGVLPPEKVRELLASEYTRVRPVAVTDSSAYRPPRALADFIRCRDRLCRFPGCDRMAEVADIDHTVPFGSGGRTVHKNLKALCRSHHLVKTFYGGEGGWRDRQLADGAVVWTSPTGHVYRTTPAGVDMFRGLAMPKRVKTRAQARRYRIVAERNVNREERVRCVAARAARIALDNSPPPF